jgi:hypothetical protein
LGCRYGGGRRPHAPEQCDLATIPFLPHVDLLLRALRVGRERLLGESKIAVDAALLRALIRAAAAAVPFDPDFYRATYPDIAAAHQAGQIPDLHRHFIETGYLEGRCGALPSFDEAFYLLTYRDVARALRAGDITSAREHYVRSGAAEGRVPSPALSAAVAAWAELVPPAAGVGAPATDIARRA